MRRRTSEHTNLRDNRQTLPSKMGFSDVSLEPSSVSFRTKIAWLRK